MVMADVFCRAETKKRLIETAHAGYTSNSKLSRAGKPIKTRARPSQLQISAAKMSMSSTFLSAIKAWHNMKSCSFFSVGLSDNSSNTEVQGFLLSIEKRSLANALSLCAFRISLLLINIVL